MGCVSEASLTVSLFSLFTCGFLADEIIWDAFNFNQQNPMRA